MRTRRRDVSAPVAAFAARLVAIAVIFAFAVLTEVRRGGPYSERQLTALYALVLTGLLLALAHFSVAVYARDRTRQPLLELAGDGLLITGFIFCSGGERSLFGFLYLLWIVHSALRAGSRGAGVTGAFATVGYGVVVLGPGLGLINPFESGAVREPARLVSDFGIHGAAFISVALLAGRLARQIQLGGDQLRELGQIHQRIVDNVSSGLLTVDAGGQITSFNREAESITGVSSEDVLGSSLAELFPSLPPTDAASIEPEPKANACRADFPFRTVDGDERHLGFSRSVLRGSRGEAEGEILIFQDLTHVVQMEEELRRRERLSAVGQLAAGLAHEIRNPLASLSGSLELLAADLPATDPSSGRLLRIVQRETARLDRLVGDFLAYAGPRPEKRVSVSLDDLFVDLQELVRSGGEPGTELELELSQGLVALGDPDQLRQVFWNLILNAAQASPSDGKVRVVARAAEEHVSGDSGRVEVEIIDQGSGIPADQLERIFEPFYTTKSKGSGLGLATVHRVIDAHGGRLEVSSTAGEGTRVRVSLPTPGA